MQNGFLTDARHQYPNPHVITYSVYSKRIAGGGTWCGPDTNEQLELCTSVRSHNDLPVRAGSNSRRTQMGGTV